jgi:autotransporter-associated beta strand protein
MELLMKKCITMVMAAMGICVHATVLEIYVPKGTTQSGFTDEQLAAVATLTQADEVRKIGPGTLRVTSIAGIGYFEGTLRVSDGVYELGEITVPEEKEDFWNGHTGMGCSGKTQVIVDGTGTLFTDHYQSINRSHYYAGTKLSLSGDGFNGQGAFVVGGKTQSTAVNNFYLAGWHIALSGDATIVKGGSAGAYSAGACTWNLNGYTLTLKNGFDLRTNESAGNERDRILSSGRIVVDGNFTYSLSPVLLEEGVDGEFICRNGALVSLTETSEVGTIYDWTNAVPTGTALTLKKSNIWKGPYSLAGGSKVRLECPDNEDFHIYNPICGDASVESVGGTGSRIYLHGKNTYSGSTKVLSGALIFMSKDSAPGWDSDRLIVEGVKQYDRIFAFAKKTEERPNGWTGPEMWNIISSFHSKQWSAGAYVDSGDDFVVKCEFSSGVSFLDMNFTSFGGGRVVFEGEYPDDFKPFNLENRCSNIVYRVADPAHGTTTMKTWWMTVADITFENMGYCYLADYEYLYARGKEGVSGGVGRLTIGDGTCIDISSSVSSGRPLSACGTQEGGKGIVTLLDGATVSNGVWAAVSDTAKGQCGSYIQRGGEMRTDKGVASFRIGGAYDSMAYAEVSGGRLSSNKAAYLGPLYNTCVSQNTGVMFHQKGGAVDFDCALNMSLAGRNSVRLSGGTFRVKSCLRVPTCDNEQGAYGGVASILAETGAQPLFEEGIVLGDRIASTGIIEVVSGAMLHTPWIKKAAATGIGGLPVRDSLAVIGFNGGGVMAVKDGAELLGTDEESVDFAIVHSAGAWLGASDGVTASISVPLVPPCGYAVSSVSLPSGTSVAAPASGVIRISGDGIGATAVAEFDSTKWSERITSLTVPSGGSGYTSASAELFVGGGVENIPLSVELVPAVATGGVIKKGLGTIVLNSVNGYGGDTVIEQGTLRVSVAGAVPSGSTVKIKEGGLLELAADVPYPSLIVADVNFDQEHRYSLVKCLGERDEPPVISNLPPKWHLVLKKGVWTAAVRRGMCLSIR